MDAPALAGIGLPADGLALSLPPSLPSSRSLSFSAGTKFVLLVSPSFPTPPSSLSPPTNPPPGRRLLATIYEAYSDSVMKNPFHTPEMPIRSELFDQRVEQIVRASATGGGS